MLLFYNKQSIQNPKGIVDSTPVGTVIAYMGTHAPKEYLICDGAEYLISDYRELAKTFKTEFGSINYFGGDGESTFAVPDLRNLFLRGFHGDSDEVLSGEIGKIQEGTVHSSIFYNSNGAITCYGPGGITLPEYFYDQWIGENTNQYRYMTSIGPETNEEKEYQPGFTSRPVNTSVLYCIKAMSSSISRDTYSTDEQIIGTWIDGRPLYRKVFQFTMPADTEQYKAVEFPLDFEPKVMQVFYNNGKEFVPLPFISPLSLDWAIACWLRPGSLYIQSGKLNEINSGQPGHLILEYTKTTDEEVSG